MRKQSKPLLVALAATSFIACHDYREDSLPPFVADDANLLAEETELHLRERPYPRGFMFAVVTHSTLDPLTAGAFADKKFEELADGSRLGKPFAQRGVLLIFSKEPELVQVRTGQEFYRQAQWAGLTMGAEYIRMQRLARLAGPDISAKEMVDWLASRLPIVEDIPWYKRMVLLDSVQSLYMELNDLSLPSESFYWTFLLKPVTTFRTLERRLFGTWWITFVAVALLAYSLRALLFLVLVSPLRKVAHPSVGSIVGILISLAVILGLALPSAASAILLAGGRLEDQIALAATGIPGIADLSFSPSFGTKRTTIGLAALLFFARLIKGFGSRAFLLRYAFLSKEEQQERYENMMEADPVRGFIFTMIGQGSGQNADIGEEIFLEKPYFWAYFRPGVEDLGAGVKWGLLGWLFLPLSLSLATIYFWIVPIILGLWKSTQSLRAFRTSTSRQRMRLATG